MAPTDFLHRLKTYAGLKDPAKPPPLSPRSAAALSVLFTLIYVLPFYIQKQTRPTPTLSRDAPTVIKARIRGVTLSCLVSAAVTIYILHQQANLQPLQILKIFGWYPVSLLDTLRVITLVAILFAGPLFESGIAEGGWRDLVRFDGVYQTMTSYVGWRNYIVGPFTEELIWRSLIVSLHLFARVKPSTIVFTTPLYFGIAHIHHLYEFRLTHPRVPLLPAVLRSLFQFTYTSLFGFFAAFVLLRTGNVWACILAHTFCNWLGLPRFWGRVGVVEAGQPIGPPGVGVKRDEDPANTSEGFLAQQHPGSLGVAWSVMYYILLITGAAGFYFGLWPLTESKGALVPI